MNKKQKACVIFMEHNKDNRFSIRSICDFLDLRRQCFNNYMWKHTTGYDMSVETQLGYLYDVEEGLLVDIIINKRKENKSMTKMKL